MTLYATFIVMAVFYIASFTKITSIIKRKSEDNYEKTCRKPFVFIS